MFEFVARHPEVGGLPAPSVTAVVDLWPSRPDEILSVAERAVEGGSEISDALLHRLASVVEAQTFFTLTSSRPNLRRRLVRANPWLLDSDGLIYVPQPELSSLLDHVSVHDDALLARLIDR